MLRGAVFFAMLTACSASQEVGVNGQESRPVVSKADEQPRDPCAGAFDYENCVDFLPAERMSGVWITGFEQSAFLSDVNGMPDPREVNGARTWLTFAAGAAPDPALRARLDALRATGVVAITFVGRRSRHTGGYGHLGSGEHLVIVDRIISANLTGPLPRP